MMTDTDFGSDPTGSFNTPTKTYKAAPTLETYLSLRRADPDAEIEVAVIGGFEAMFYMRDEFERHGLDPGLLGGILDSDPQAVSETSLRLIELMIAARQREADGGTHLASRGETVPDKLIDWIICCALDSMSWNNELTLPRDLIVLIRERLGGSSPHYEQAGRVRKAKSSAAMIAGQLKAQGINPTLRMLGRVLQVAPSTVKRWFEPGELEREAEVWAAHFDKNGQLRPLTSPKRPNVAPNS